MRGDEQELSMSVEKIKKINQQGMGRYRRNTVGNQNLPDYAKGPFSFPMPLRSNAEFFAFLDPNKSACCCYFAFLIFRGFFFSLFFLLFFLTNVFFPPGESMTSYTTYISRKVEKASSGSSGRCSEFTANHSNCCDLYNRRCFSFRWWTEPSAHPRAPCRG